MTDSFDDGLRLRGPLEPMPCERYREWHWRGTHFGELYNEKGHALLSRREDDMWRVLGFIYPEDAAVFYDDTLTEGDERKPRPGVGAASKKGGLVCRRFGHDWHWSACRGDNGEPAGEACRRCRSERSIPAGSICRCITPDGCHCAEYDEMVREGWSEWMRRRAV